MNCDMRIWIAAGIAAAAMAGCTNGVIGSCTYASGSACADFITYNSGNPPAQSCVDALVGTWAEAVACPTAGRVGRCHVETERGVANVTYYAPRTAAEARTDCMGIEGGTFED